MSFDCIKLASACNCKVLVFPWGAVIDLVFSLGEYVVKYTTFYFVKHLHLSCLSVVKNDTFPFIIFIPCATAAASHFYI